MEKIRLATGHVIAIRKDHWESFLMRLELRGLWERFRSIEAAK
jgi:hypothetical protein